MTTQYEQAVAALAETAGVEIKIGEDRVATMVVEERVVQLRPSDEVESGITAFTIVASTEGDGFERSTLEAALMMNLFGAETGKGSHRWQGPPRAFRRFPVPLEGHRDRRGFVRGAGRAVARVLAPLRRHRKAARQR